jgi:WD40 repeat protein
MLVLTGHHGPIRALAYAPGDASTLASAGADGTVRLWNPLTRQNWATFHTQWHLSFPLAFSPDGGRLATANLPGGLCLWDVAMERPITTLSLQQLSPVVGAVFLPDGDRLVAAGQTGARLGEGGLLELFRLSTRESLVHRRFFVGGIACMGLSADGQTLVLAGNHHRTVTLLDPENFQPRRPPIGIFRGAVGSLALSTAGNARMAVGTGPAIELWDIPAGKRQLVLRGHRGAVRALAFSPDGRLLLSGGIDRSVRLWDLDAGKERATYNWEVGPVHAVAFAPDGMTAAAAGETGAILVWDVEMG